VKPIGRHRHGWDLSRCKPRRKSENHSGVIREERSPTTDWLDSCCWGCGTQEVDTAADGRLLCGACREEILSEPVADSIDLARHAYWGSHVLRCCWRCMTGAVDPDDEVGMCPSCRAEIRDGPAEGAA
jgi:hypothetical protein